VQDRTRDLSLPKGPKPNQEVVDRFALGLVSRELWVHWRSVLGYARREGPTAEEGELERSCCNPTSARHRSPPGWMPEPAAARLRIW